MLDLIETLKSISGHFIFIKTLSDTSFFLYPKIVAAYSRSLSVKVVSSKLVIVTQKSKILIN